jgi:hypothetical protein
MLYYLYSLPLEQVGRDFCSYLFLLALNLFYWVGWCSLRRERERQHEAGIKLLPMVGATALCFVLLGASAALHGGISLASAYTTLSSGQAEVFYQEAMERLVILKDPSVRVARLKSTPTSSWPMV